MNKKLSIYLLGATFLLSSCRSMRNLAAKDNSAGSSGRKNTTNNSGFLENISVTPGNNRTSVLTTNNSNNTVFRTVTPAKNIDIENVQQVQIKYATMLDIPVEDITNISLFKDIDYWWGTRYCMGGSTETCIDCSAFTQNIIHDIYAVQLPRTAEEQYNAVTRIDASELKEGDLVFFQTSGRSISHVGIYLANNKFVHASVSNGVMISDLNDAYWKPKFRAAGRVSK